MLTIEDRRNLAFWFEGYQQCCLDTSDPLVEYPFI